MKLSYFVLFWLLPQALGGQKQGVRGAKKIEDDAFVKTSTSPGFGDPQNNYAFSSAQLRGDVYVGTGRNFLFRIFDAFIQLGILPADYEFSYITSPNGDAWSLERAQDMSAEIWRLRKGEWEKVYTSSTTDVSPLYPFPLPVSPAFAAREPGFRSMVTFKNAIYAASAASIVPGRLLIKSSDGDNWEDVVTFPKIPESDSRSMVVHNGKLYVGPAGAPGGGSPAKLWAAADPPTDPSQVDNWELKADFTNMGSGTNVAVVSMVSWNDRLYVGTQNDEDGFQLWRSNSEEPSMNEWTNIIMSGAGDKASTRALTMTVFKDSLIVGTSMFPLGGDVPFILQPKGFEIIRVDEYDNWELLVGDYFAQKPVDDELVLRIPKSGWPGGFANFLNLYAWSLYVYQGNLYVGSFDTTSFLALPFLQDNIAKSAADAFALLMPDPEARKNAVSESASWLQEAIKDPLNDLELSNIPEAYRELIDLLTSFPTDWDAVLQLLIGELAGADLWRTTDGIHWEAVTLNGFDEPTNYGFRTMITHAGLHVGSANPFEGLDMYIGKPNNK